MRVVLDTNILVSALLNRHGNEALVLTATLGGKFDLVLSPAVLLEYELVLHRPKFGFSQAEVRATLTALRRAGQLVRPTKAVTTSPDESDNRFLECAEAGQADCLVTGNIKHFPAKWGKTHIVRAAALIEHIRPKP
jgi:putative PIN family toxin of toxin-antitoxin system